MISKCFFHKVVETFNVPLLKASNYYNITISFLYPLSGHTKTKKTPIHAGSQPVIGDFQGGNKLFLNGNHFNIFDKTVTCIGAINQTWQPFLI